MESTTRSKKLCKLIGEPIVSCLLHLIRFILFFVVRNRTLTNKANHDPGNAKITISANWGIRMEIDDENNAHAKKWTLLGLLIQV